MPRKICGLGFDCASMMLQPGIDPGFCLNYETCGAATKLTPDEEIELIRVREIEIRSRRERRQRVQETIRTTRRQAAVMMLMSRGCPQNAESLGVTAQMQEIAACVEQLHHQLNNLEGHYIAPPGCEVHHYNVKRPSGVYGYNKLTASEPIFEPSEKQERVRVIHLSHDYDPRNVQARLGIDRRNKLTRVRTLLAGAVELLQSCASTLSDESLVQSNSLLMTVDSRLSTHEVSEPSPAVGDRPITNEPNPSPNHLVEIVETQEHDTIAQIETPL
ncbi:hypothetical protein NOS3756_59800 (plasmid) [Nostoc sp. NIES-3756]|uniref:hypothetical protein n=1 Tax=Nostoc sp. NIES-3756 TaxID=1751286 RepID=UPI00072032C0|nr:hypothetical protein [Nostoc sp. NIES-3756]BAT56968.1 hypothetical protein NOS3756_59800 [Nostoc sp. NIES-3756]